MKKIGIFMSLIITFALTGTSSSNPITIPSSLTVAISNHPEGPSTQSVHQSISSASPGTEEYSLNYDSRLATNPKRGLQKQVENSDFQSCNVIMGRKKNPHILKSSKGHLFPRINANEVSPSVNPVTNSDELGNKNVIVVQQSSVQPSFLTNDFNTVPVDLATESHASTSSELPVTLFPSDKAVRSVQETFKPVPVIISEGSESSKTFEIGDPEKKLFPHKLQVRNHLKHILHRSKEEMSAMTPHEPPAPRDSIISSILHKKKYLRKEVPVTEEPSNASDHNVHTSSTLHKKLDIPSVSSLLHRSKVHHISRVSFL